MSGVYENNKPSLSHKALDVRIDILFWFANILWATPTHQGILCKVGDVQIIDDLLRVASRHLPANFQGHPAFESTVQVRRIAVVYQIAGGPMQEIAHDQFSGWTFCNQLLATQDPNCPIVIGITLEAPTLPPGWVPFILRPDADYSRFYIPPHPH